MVCDLLRFTGSGAILFACCLNTQAKAARTSCFQRLIIVNEELLFRRGEPGFLAFDFVLQWRGPPISGNRSVTFVCAESSRTVETDCCTAITLKLLAGLRGTRKYEPYLLDGSTKSLKIRSRNYSQWAGRRVVRARAI